MTMMLKLSSGKEIELNEGDLDELKEMFGPKIIYKSTPAAAPAYLPFLIQPANSNPWRWPNPEVTCGVGGTSGGDSAFNGTRSLN